MYLYTEIEVNVMERVDQYHVEGGMAKEKLYENSNPEFAE